MTQIKCAPAAPQSNGDGTFTSASIQSAIAAQIVGPEGELSGFFGYSFAPTFADIDSDGDQDLLLASDFALSKIFANNGDGTFLDITDRDVVIDGNGLGSSTGDCDNDGDTDIFHVNGWDRVDPRLTDTGQGRGAAQP